MDDLRRPLERMFDYGRCVGGKNPERVLRELKTKYSAAVVALHDASSVFLAAGVPVGLPPDGEVVHYWTPQQIQAAKSLAEAWSRLIAARRNYETYARTIEHGVIGPGGLTENPSRRRS